MNRALLVVLLVAGCSSKEASKESPPAADKQVEAKQPDQPELKPEQQPEQPEAVPEQVEAPATGDEGKGDGEATPEPEQPQQKVTCYPANGDNPNAVCNPAFECDNKVVYEVDCEAAGKTNMKCTCMADGEEISSFNILRSKCDDLLSADGVTTHCKLPVRLIEE